MINTASFTRTAVLGALLLAAASPALAEDPRLLTRAYDGDAVVHIDGRLGVQAVIAFAEDEHIENVAVGDAEKWQITPNKRANLLFVKPLSASARTNMTVVTDRHTYFFDLAAAARARPVYMLRFTYPDDPKAAPPQKAEPLTEAERLALSQPPADPASLNFSWDKRGAARLMPSRLYDDGQSTYLVWGDKQDVPAILIRNEKGEEGPVNYAVRGQAIVLDAVPDLIVLRSGKAQATLERRAPPPSSVSAPEVAAATSSPRQGQ